MKKIKYSFITPHHNNPDLLLRLINSIPYRNDIEIIVVDDNSTQKPYNLPPHCLLIEIDAKHSKGAGRARNIGMDSAVGEWILFPDCDDFYTTDILNVLDAYTNERQLEMVFFDVFYNYDTVRKKELSSLSYHNDIKQYLKNPDNTTLLKKIKHEVQTPWNFAINSEFLKRTHVRYEEVPIGNDFYFHHKTAMMANKVKIIPNRLYYWCYTPGSITNKKRTNDERLQYVKERGKESILLKIEAGAWSTIPLLHRLFLSRILKYGVIHACKCLKINLSKNIPWGKIYLHKWILRD